MFGDIFRNNNMCLYKGAWTNESLASDAGIPGHFSRWYIYCSVEGGGGGVDEKVEVYIDVFEVNTYLVPGAFPGHRSGRPSCRPESNKFPVAIAAHLQTSRGSH